METSYDDQLAKVVGGIEQLAKELLSRTDRDQDGVIESYLQQMDAYKRELLNLKTQHFLEGGLYE